MIAFTHVRLGTTQPRRYAVQRPWHECSCNGIGRNQRSRTKASVYPKSRRWHWNKRAERSLAADRPRSGIRRCPEPVRHGGTVIYTPQLTTCLQSRWQILLFLYCWSQVLSTCKCNKCVHGTFLKSIIFNSEPFKYQRSPYLSWEKGRGPGNQGTMWSRERLNCLHFSRSGIKGQSLKSQDSIALWKFQQNIAGNRKI